VARKVDVRTRLRNVLENPFFDFAPWIVMSVLEGPGRFELSVSLACTTAAALVLLNWLVGVKPKVLDDVGVAFFAALILAGLLVDHGGQRWLDRYSADLSNTVIALIALGSIVVHKPFTVQYAHETVAPELWQTPRFMRLNYRVTWVWTGAFVLTSLVGFLGDGPLDQPDNVWTNWIVQIAALILALRFTEWYPDAAIARERFAAGDREEPPPTVRDLVLPLAGYLVPVGVVVLCVGGAPWWVGAGLVVLGSVAAHRLNTEEQEIEEEEIESGEIA
jgi:hypothetical protein